MILDKSFSTVNLFYFLGKKYTSYISDNKDEMKWDKEASGSACHLE